MTVLAEVLDRPLVFGRQRLVGGPIYFRTPRTVRSQRLKAHDLRHFSLDSSGQGALGTDLKAELPLRLVGVRHLPDAEEL